MQAGLTQVELATRMRVEKASLTGVLNSLEAKGLIARARNRQDRRKVNLRLTEAGAGWGQSCLPARAQSTKRQRADAAGAGRGSARCSTPLSPTWKQRT